MADEPEQDIAKSAGGEGEQPGRIAGLVVTVILVGVAVLVMKAIVTVAPYVAYFVAGILVTLGVQKARARWGQRGDRAEAEQQEAATPDVGAALRRLVGDDNGVLLTRLQRDLKLPNTKVVKALLEDAGIEWKAGVRTAHGNGPGVHKTAIPPAPSPAEHSHGEGCCCRSGANANANSGDGEGHGEGIRVEAIGDGGYLAPARADLQDLVDRFLAEAEKRRQNGDH